MPPMDDASSVATQSDMIPPTDGQNIGSGEGMEPQGDMEIGNDMGGDMSDMGNSEPTGKTKEIMDTVNSISEKDQDTLLAYARSLKDASDESNNDMGEQKPQMPMESVILTKGQLKKLNEEFGIENLSGGEKENKPNEKK